MSAQVEIQPNKGLRLTTRAKQDLQNLSDRGCCYMSRDMRHILKLGNVNYSLRQASDVSG